MNTYFIVWVIIQYYLIFYSNCSSFGHWELLQSALCPSDIPNHCGFFLSTIFFVAQDAPSPSCTFIAPVLE